ncbi:MAG TPA: PEP/pyruvate-binding domain-containing protein, partial [Methylocella sp.]|nr:PEP/pyruvate-binding domain-containing protein [Methylocella sp.]
MAKWVYVFGQGTSGDAAASSDLLGGKGAGLAEMARLGLPVPPGFTLTTEVCSYFYTHGKQFPPGLEGAVEEALDFIARATGHRFGDARDPLLVSARSGAKFSMPGMMDTVLNLGLNDIAVEALAARSGDERFAYDSCRRFIQMYASVVLGIEHHIFEEILERYKENKGVTFDTELTSEDWKRLVAEFKRTVEKNLSLPFPQDPREQLWGAIGAVFESWMNPRAANYRRLQNIPENLGTAVTVQAMVFGNMGDTSATGVAFTRNPSTGEKELFGEFLLNAQGEDVV